VLSQRNGDVRTCWCAHPNNKIWGLQELRIQKLARAPTKIVPTVLYTTYPQVIHRLSTVDENHFGGIDMLRFFRKPSPPDVGDVVNALVQHVRRLEIAHNALQEHFDALQSAHNKLRAHVYGSLGGRPRGTVTAITDIPMGDKAALRRALLPQHQPAPKE